MRLEIILAFILFTTIFSAPSFGQEVDQPKTWNVLVDKQIMIEADIKNNQDVMQSFAYITQIRDSNGIVVSLSWLTGSLSPGQSFSPAQSWTPTMPGTYTVDIFVWQSLDNPDALSPPLSMVIVVEDDNDNVS